MNTASLQQPDQETSAQPQPAELTGAVQVPHVLLALLLIVLAGLLWAGPQRIGSTTSDLLQAYLEAQQTMLEASGNLRSDGRAGFAVMLNDGVDAEQLRVAMANIEGVSFERAADLSGWAVITTVAGNRDGLDAMLKLPQSRLVVPNRGIWICH